MSEAALIDAVAHIAKGIVDCAEWSRNTCSWHVVDSPASSEARSVTRYKPAGPGLYQGASGIALFLSEAAVVTGERQLAACAAAALGNALESADRFGRVGLADDGLSGIAYVLARVATITREQRWADAARGIVQRIRGSETRDKNHDLIGGAAGAVPALLRVADWVDDEEARTCAVRFGDHLISTARQRAIGWSWRTSQQVAADDLLGMAHGVSGVATALMELHAATGATVYRYAAEQGFAYESSYYDAQQRNWPDLRREELLKLVDRRLSADELRSRLGGAKDSLRDENLFPVLWCHGAPGIGLARCRAFEVTGEDRYTADVRVAAEVTEQSLDIDKSFALCHGNFGNSELLLRAASVLRDVRWATVAIEFANAAVERYGSAGPWPCGTWHQIKDPGLFCGEAGIGHFLLRLMDPTIPSVVLLAADGRQQLPASSQDLLALRRRHVDHYFGVSAAVAEQDLSHAASLRQALDGPACLNPVLAASEALASIATAEPRSLVADAMRLEQKLFDLDVVRVDRTRYWVAANTRPALDEVVWDTATVSRADDVSIVTQDRNWKSWAAIKARAEDAPTEPMTYAVYRRGDGAAAFVRLSPIEAAVLTSIVGPVRAVAVLDALSESPLSERDPATARANGLAALQRLHAIGCLDTSSADV